jgi:hypothetical protein
MNLISFLLDKDEDSSGMREAIGSKNENKQIKKKYIKTAKTKYSHTKYDPQDNTHCQTDIMRPDEYRQRALDDSKHNERQQEDVDEGEGRFRRSAARIMQSFFVQIIVVLQRNIVVQVVLQFFVFIRSYTVARKVVFESMHRIRHRVVVEKLQDKDSARKILFELGTRKGVSSVVSLRFSNCCE